MVSAEYLAGFIDGEGYVALGRIPRRNQSVEYPVRLVVYNTSDSILREIQEAWGGTLSRSESRNLHWKPQYALIWTNAAAAVTLSKVVPFLRVKVEQAATLLEFHAHIRGYPRARDYQGRLMPLPSAEVEFRSQVYERLKRMNARGRLGSAPALGKSDNGSTVHVASSPSPAYLAGFLDGEGSIMITRWKGRATWNPQYRARIALSNTYRPVLEQIQEASGGMLVNDSRADASWKDSYQLVWSGGMVERLLSSILPHLRLKQEQAAILLEFVQHVKATRKHRLRDHGKRSAALTADALEYRDELFQRMKKLNAKGILPNPART